MHKPFQKIQDKITQLQLYYYILSTVSIVITSAFKLQSFP